MRPYLEDIWPQFFEIFGDNCEQKRRIFFNEPLISHLWAMFRRRCEADISALLKKTCESDSAQGRLKMKLFMKEIDQMEH